MTTHDRLDSVAGPLTEELLRELAAAPAELPPGAMINGRYRIVRVLGEGGMGRVHEVIDELRPEPHLALKMIAGGRVSSDRIALFKAEFETLARLRHPNVAEVYDFGRLDGERGGDPFFTMDWSPDAASWRRRPARGGRAWSPRSSRSAAR